MIINLPQLDDSASLLGVVQDEIYGFPVANLHGLYLFEDGAVGAAYAGTAGAATDSSGAGRHAALTGGSAPVRIAEGVKTGDVLGNGFQCRTSILANQPFSVVLVTRNRTPRGTNADSYPTLMAATHNCTSPNGDVSSAVGTANNGTYGAVALNHDSSNAGSPDTREVAIYARDAANVAWTGAGSVRPQHADGVAPKASWTTIAFSFDPVAGRIRSRALGTSKDFTALAAATAWKNGAGNILVGMSRYGTPNVIMGDVGLAAIYSAALDDAGLQSLVAAAKARMALRGVTAG